MLSESVANCLQIQSYPQTVETQNFLRYFNKFFDCLNVRTVHEGQKKRNENLLPYRLVDDSRLKVSFIQNIYCTNKNRFFILALIFSKNFLFLSRIELQLT